MTKIKSITNKELEELLEYNHETGFLHWKVNRSYRAQAGDIAGSINNFGYRAIKINGRSYKAHRLAWQLFHNEEPFDYIDHINGIKDDNRISNLRVVNRSGNARNMPLSRNNKSGLHGVHWCKTHERWVSSIYIRGKQKCLGYFDNIFDAACARKSAEHTNGYHINHGRTLILQETV